jgi:hypothetical protein
MKIPISLTWESCGVNATYQSKTMGLSASIATTFGYVCRRLLRNQAWVQSGSYSSAGIVFPGCGLDRDGLFKVQGRASRTLWRCGPAWGG